MYRIFIVEDDRKIAHILQGYLEKYGYEGFIAGDLRDVKAEFLAVKPHLVLLDINLPYYDGFYWCRQIRTVSNAPVMYISARTGEMDQVLAIENGGDDYITKPFSLDVVLAKVKGLLRRTYGEYALASNTAENVLDIAGLYVDRNRLTVEWQGKQTDLTHNECRLLYCLAERVGQVVSREDILEALWDDTHFVDDNTLTVNVTRLRKKLEQLEITEAIETIRGQGYRLRVTWGYEA